jgi:heme exporter protein D
MLKQLWDIQIVLYVGLTGVVILISLAVLLVTSRRVRYLMDEVQGLRREMKLIDEALQTVTASLQRSVNDSGPR